MTQGTDNVSVRVQSLSTSSSPLDVQVTVSPGQAVPFYISSLFEQPLGNVVTNDGVRITASSPIFASYSGQNRTRVVNSHNCLSHLSDQLPPVVNLGRKFVLLSTPEQDAGDLYRFIAAHPFTTVVVESVPKTTIHLLSPGDFYEYDLASQSYLYAESDRPVMVVQLTKTPRSIDFPGDPSMGVLAPLEQAESFYVFPQIDKWEYVYMTFVIQR